MVPRLRQGMAIAKVHPRLKAQTATQVPRMVVPHLCRPFHNIPIYLPGPPVMQLRVTAETIITDLPTTAIPTHSTTIMDHHLRRITREITAEASPLLTTITVARLGTTLTTHRGAPTRASMLALLTLGMVTHPTRKAPRLHRPRSSNRQLRDSVLQSRVGTVASERFDAAVTRTPPGVGA